MVTTVLFSFDTPVGTFSIEEQPPDRVLLGINGNSLKTYRSAAAAAEAVRDRKTGYEPWDSLGLSRVPDTLKNWKRADQPT
jgi:hypothetical protein